ncbi:MAG: glutamate 5-kinase [Nanoarchaeota archaeon]|nr:glutamate 5-kinase [Nanoarchaeota archaeon]
MRDFSNAKRIVVKVGTNVLTKKNAIDSDYIKKIANEISKLVDKGIKVILVSSGAIGFGSMKLKLKQKPRDIKLRQALAAIGQRILMNEYAKAFDKYNVEVAQILLTYDVISERKTFLNLRNCVENLLKMNIVPIINENDVISIDEIGTRFGDNDRLSAMVASKIDADLLILLSDIDGLYTDNPKKNKNAKKLKIVKKITPDIEKFAGKSGSIFAVGGMKSKIDAAKITMRAGCSMVIAPGRKHNIISDIIDGKEIGTLFLAERRISSRKRWIINAKPNGKIIINECAEKVLKEGKSSLLPIGITSIEGSFKKGDVVVINDFAKAVPDLSSKEIDKIKGMKSKDICTILKKKCRDEVIKKENIVLV